MSVTIAVPEKVIARFVVTADLVPEDIPSMIRQCLPTQYTDSVTERLGTPLLDVSEHQAVESHCGLENVTASDADDLKKVQGAARHIHLTSVLPATDLPHGLHLARVATEALAESLCSVPVDLDTARVLPGNPFDRPERFLLADEWLGVSLPSYRSAGACPAKADDIDGCACVDLRTRGLPRFGLPDLEITDVACAHDLAALNILRTTAQRVLPLGRHPGKHILSAELLLSSDDFSGFWGAHGPLWEDGPLPVRLAKVGSSRLSVQAPEDFPGTLNEWLWDELPPILHELLSCEPDDLHPT
ncbi:hypothetical protein AGRA3207_007608 [Actinomadura graeca]|uniref:Uncharacterized protein n=1 Tax=Actinomadura graeca TaxID=2750812 RepID=A0ABX8R5B4_9ACTN|nr:hypothetical protein [Actinomadura graeca]QXJ26023.1 hypothetical protein AGRA3207_007608 [Actinomadura graeca]